MSVSGGGPQRAGPAAAGRAARRPSLEWIGEAWRLFSAQAGTWIVSCLVTALLPFVLYIILLAAFGASLAVRGPRGFGANGLPAGFSDGLTLFVILFWAACGLLYAPFIQSGVYRMAVRQVRGEPIGIGDIFGGGPRTLKMLGCQIVYGLLGLVLVLAVFILLSLLHLSTVSAFNHQLPVSGPAPGLGGMLLSYSLFLLCWAVVFTLLFPVHAQVADGEGVFAAMGRSVSAMKTRLPAALGILFLFGLLCLVSAAPCGLGLFVTIPMFWLLSALAYRDVSGMPVLTPSPAPVPSAAPGVWPPPPRRPPP